MQEHKPTYDESLSLLKEFNKNERLLQHAYSIEGAMRYMARKAGEDEEKWGIIGLIHDLDSELFAEEHCKKSRELLEARGWPEEYIRAVVSHGWDTMSDAEPQTKLEKTLYTIDKLAWVIARIAFKDPSKSLADLSAEAVMEKWGDESLVPARHRSVIEKGVLMLGADFRELATDVIMALRPVADKIGL